MMDSKDYCKGQDIKVNILNRKRGTFRMLMFCNSLGKGGGFLVC